MERTVVLVKPDGVQRGLIGQITDRFERKGLRLCAVKMVALDDPILDQWYFHHKDKPFFKDLKNFMKSSPVVAMVWEGLEEAGTIRGDFGMSGSHNLIHASDSPENAAKELKLVFKKEEIFDYHKDEYSHIYTDEEQKE